MSLLTEVHATNAVNSLLNSVLPGSSEINVNQKKQRRDKGSKAQLIASNLKKRVIIQEKDVHKIKKQQKKLQKKRISSKKTAWEALEQKAKLEILRKHQSEDNLTEHEKEYLSKVMNKNIRSVKSWDTEDKEELSQLQKTILDESSSSRHSRRAKSRKQRKKAFKEEIPAIVTDHRYPGLTPGLAPVGYSDEEEE